jgi:hypothetical protein
MYLNPIVFCGPDVKTLQYCFPPKLSQQVWPQVSPETL